MGKGFIRGEVVDKRGRGRARDIQIYPANFGS